jgi:hypothetical protein
MQVDRKKHWPGRGIFSHPGKTHRTEVRVDGATIGRDVDLARE